jgi:hypothetical protein
MDDLGSISSRGKGFFHQPLSRPALRPIQLPYQMGTGGWGVMLTTHPYLVPRSRMSRSYISSLFGACKAISGQFYFYFTAEKQRFSAAKTKLSMMFT